MSDLSGRTLGPYRVLEQLGAGGMATVYKAYQPAMDRYVALKVLPQHLAQDPGFRERFNREARTIARLEHRHILPVYDVGEIEAIPFLVMRYTAGGTLGDQIAAGTLPLARAAQLAEQVAEALSYAHREGVVHRDVKPANVLLDRDGSALLTDFGIARIVAGSLQLTAEGALIGTPFYMAPEQAQGKPADARTDIYALGVVLYEMVTGRRPYVAETPLAVALMHVHEPLPLPRRLNPAIPEPLERVILKALAKRAEDRFQTADELVEALRGLAPLLAAASTSLPAPAPTVVLPESRPLAPTPAAPGPRRMMPWLVAGAIAALLAVGAFVAGPRLMTPAAVEPTAAAIRPPGPSAIAGAGVSPRPKLRVFPAGGTVSQIAATGDTLWAATTGGLARYDAEGRPRLFTAADGLPFNRASALATAPDGTLWIADYDRVAHVTPSADGLAAVRGYGEREGLAIGQIHALAVDPSDGAIWAGGDGGVLRFDGSSWRLPELPLDDPVLTSLAGPVVALLRASDGSLWAGRGDGGLVRWDGTRWSSFAEAQGVGRAATYQLFQDNAGVLWATALEQGLLRFDPAREAWTQALSLPEFTLAFQVSQLADGRLWLTTSGGVQQSEDGGATWSALETPEGYLGNGQIAQTDDGRLWLGGVSRYADGAWTRLPSAGVMPFEHVAELVTAPDGKLWALQRYGGRVAIVDPQSFEVSTHPLEARVSTVAFSADTSWFGTSDGLIRLRNDARLNLTTADGLPSNDVRQLLATDDALWIGTDKGLARYDLASEQVTSSAEFAGGIVETLLLAPDGAVWAGSLREDTAGFGLLGRFDGASWRLWRQGDLPNPEDAVEVTRLRADSAGNIWLLTWSSGLFRWDGERWRTWSVEDGAPQSTLLAVTPRGDEVLIGGALGGSLYRWNEDGWATIPIDGLSGVVEDLLITPDGALWLATDDNLLRVAPQ